MIWMNIKKYEEIKRRIVALALASSIGFTSFALSGCKSKNDIIDGEASNGYSSVLDRDNRSKSADSRRFGCIPIKKIQGKVVLRWWPVNKIKII